MSAKCIWGMVQSKVGICRRFQTVFGRMGDMVIKIGLSRKNLKRFLAFSIWGLVYSKLGCSVEIEPIFGEIIVVDTLKIVFVLGLIVNLEI